MSRSYPKPYAVSGKIADATMTSMMVVGFFAVVAVIFIVIDKVTHADPDDRTHALVAIGAVAGFLAVVGITLAVGYLLDNASARLIVAGTILVIVAMILTPLAMAYSRTRLMATVGALAAASVGALCIFASLHIAKARGQEWMQDAA